MSKYRYIITFETDDEFDTNNEHEKLRQEIISTVDDYYVTNLKVTCEDDCCIRKNDKLNQDKRNIQEIEDTFYTRIVKGV